MYSPENNSLDEFQKIINYKFKQEEYLKNALTTPLLGKLLNIPDYETLEILGDAVIKLIFISKKIKEGIKDPGQITITKQCIENDETLSKIAEKYFYLEKFIRKSDKQIIKGTRILADVFEALCGALFIDSNFNLEIVEEKLIKKFYDDWDLIIKDTSIFNKNRLLEYIQRIYRITPTIKVDFENKGPVHAPKWIAKNPNILNNRHEILIPLKKAIKSKECKSKKEAEQDLYLKILKILRKRKQDK